MFKCNTFACLLPRPYSKMVFTTPFRNLAGRLFVTDISVAIDDYTGEFLKHPIIEKFRIVKSPAKVYYSFLFIINMK
jgi:hypothetical protein